MNKTNLYNFDSVETHIIAVEGMRCDSCVRKIEAALSKQKGVKGVQANLKNKEITVTFDSKDTNMPQLHEVLLSTGYHPTATV